MAVNDRIKDIATIRKWVREFSLFGEKTRTDFTATSGYRYAVNKSLKLLKGYLTESRDDNNCKHVFLAVDARDIAHNPLFVYFKIHAFKDNDIKLHFVILNALADGKYKTIGQVYQSALDSNIYDVEADGGAEKDSERETSDDALDEDAFDLPLNTMDSTIRRKLEEYLANGILVAKKSGRKKVYSLNTCSIDLKRWVYAIDFFSEIDPLGVIGSFLRDRLDRTGGLPACDPFVFRHHYVHHVLDAEIVQTIADAIHKHCSVVVVNHPMHQNNCRANQKNEVVPIRFYHSVQSGRRYIVACQRANRQLTFLRIDRIQTVSLGSTVPDYLRYYEYAIERLKHVWGVSDIGNRELTHLEMTIRVSSPDDYAIKRIDIEKRHGTVEYLDNLTACFSIDVWEDREMLPWVRTFIGSIISLKCSNQNFIDRFNHDLRKSLKQYTERMI